LQSTKFLLAEYQKKPLPAICYMKSTRPDILIAVYMPAIPAVSFYNWSSLLLPHFSRFFLQFISATINVFSDINVGGIIYMEDSTTFQLSK
jgi:hypothetical protein